MKNILIVNFNTTELTKSCILSVNKTTDDCSIYVWDNSDKTPFSTHMDYVTVLDNTKGQLLDFPTELSKYELVYEYGTELNSFASLKHTMTIDRFLQMTEEPFVLMDSDVLVKKDISDLFDTSKAYIGEVGLFRGIKKLLPFICYINTPMCREHNIRYFNPDKMYGIKGDYDTGASFLEEAQHLPHRDIKYRDYILHYEAGSYNRGDRRNNSAQWLNQNRRYFE